MYELVLDVPVIHRRDPDDRAAGGNPHRLVATAGDVRDGD